MPDSFELESLNEADLPKYDPDIPHLRRFEDFKTIDWVRDNLESNKTSIELFKTQKSNATKGFLEFYKIFQLYIILTTVGVIIGLVAACLNIITEYLSNIRTGYCSSGFYLNRNFCCWGEAEETCSSWVEYSHIGVFNYIIFIIISIAFSLTASKLVLYYAPFAAGSGISEIKCIVSGFSFDAFLNFVTFAMKSIGLPLAIASGLSVGKEGPSVHYAVCVGSVISKLFAMKLEKKSSGFYRNILIASSGAGVAVAFGSPMGGVLFSIEEISNLFKLSTMWESYYCSLIAVSVLQMMNPFRTGQVVMFEVGFDQDWHLFEIPFYIILGLFGGIYGIVVSKFNIKAVSFRKKYLGGVAIQEVFMLTLITAMISYFNEFLKLDMTEGMQLLFQTCNETSKHHTICNLESKTKSLNLLLSLTLATLIRMVLIVFTYGCKVPAGIFVPSMACGATFGRSLGIIAQLIRDTNPNTSFFTSGCLADDKYCINPGVYAFLGAGAALSGITHLTVTVVVIMFELTGALKYVIPSMISVAVTKIINDKYGKGGIADQMIEFNGLPFIHPHEDLDFHGYKAVDAMTSKIVVLTESGMKFGQLKKILQSCDYQNFPIVQKLSNPVIKGCITRDDLNQVIGDYAQERVNDNTTLIFKKGLFIEDNDGLNFTNFVNYSPISVELKSTLEIVLHFFHKVGPGVLLVEDRGKLRGLITRKDILRFQYYLHNLHVDHSKLSDEQTFANEDNIWATIESTNNYITQAYQDIANRFTNGYRHINS